LLGALREQPGRKLMAVVQSSDLVARGIEVVL
jgi:hypothetical protein